MDIKILDRIGSSLPRRAIESRLHRHSRFPIFPKRRSSGGCDTHELRSRATRERAL